ncbi:hypothetical protein GCM10010517_41260 [Streptosporangium fragile]|uniref:Uncharacterized protein n=1 Tax=Streptosporangium fragile TaxID=46186 RepID=A0ABP6IFQ5_9ACTN
MTTRRRTSTLTLLAGWLFADLLLGLTIVMLGAQAPPPSPVRSLADGAHPLPGASPSPSDAAHPLPGASPSPSDSSRPLTGATEPPSDSGRLPAEENPASEEDLAGSPAAEETPLVEESPAPKKSPGPTRSAPSPSASPCIGRVAGVRAKPITLSFRVTPGAGDAVLAAQIRQELRKHRDRLAGRHAGMVLTFGADGGTGNGVRLATRVNTVIREAYPRIFGTAVTRNFHDLAAPSGSISMEIYFMTYGCSPASGNPGSPGK